MIAVSLLAEKFAMIFLGVAANELCYFDSL